MAESYLPILQISQETPVFSWFMTICSYHNLFLAAYSMQSHHPPLSERQTETWRGNRLDFLSDRKNHENWHILLHFTDDTVLESQVPQGQDHQEPHFSFSKSSLLLSSRGLQVWAEFNIQKIGAHEENVFTTLTAQILRSKRALF